MKAKIKSIPVTEVKIGMQVIHDDIIYTIDKDNFRSFKHLITELTQLAIQYNTCNPNRYGYVDEETVKQIELLVEYPSWQNLIDRKLVNSNEYVEFYPTIFGTNEKGLTAEGYEYFNREVAKIKGEQTWKYISGKFVETASEWQMPHIKFVATRFAHECRLKGVITNNETIKLFDKWFPDFSKTVK